jgi:hypothetical protein
MRTGFVELDGQAASAVLELPGRTVELFSLEQVRKSHGVDKVTPWDLA